MLSRTDSAEALKVPVTQIPCGSANSMFSTIIKEFNCLTNAENWKQIQIDCLNWIPKLNKVKHDGILFKLSNGQSRHSFLNTEFGMMALVDKTSEVLRFLGDIRFPLGSMYHLASMKFHKATLYVLNTNDFVDAVQSAQDTISNAEELKNNVTSISSAELNSIIKEFSIELDPIRMDEAISWKCIKGPFLSVYASIKRMIMLNVETDRDLKLANNFISLNYQDDQTTRLHQLKLTRYLQNGVQLVNNISIKSIKSPAFVLLCPTESLFMIDGESYYLRCVYGELQKEIFTTLAPDTL
ncbi:hypothetical protein GJ496_007591 [Pomphorhynchus laevis]|nr:hypothetical protein GJ496_007591 [Pomphorhynchus laevis]